MPFRLFKGLLPWRRAAAVRDAAAGVVLASMDIPQLLGYARIAGMPAVAGLYTGLLPIVAFALFGASRNLVVAADSATATIFASKLSTLAAPASAQYIALAAMTALLTSLMLLIARVFRLGFLADFLSRTVLVGFLAGVGVQVGVAMLGDMLGIAVSSRATLEQLGLIATHLSAIQWPAFAISALVVATILLFRHYRPRWPVALLAVVLGIWASIAWNFAGRGIGVIGPLGVGATHLQLSELDWSRMLGLLQISASCFVVPGVDARASARRRAPARRIGASLVRMVADGWDRGGDVGRGGKQNRPARPGGGGGDQTWSSRSSGWLIAPSAPQSSGRSASAI